MADCQAQGPRFISGVIERRHVANTMEKCEDHTAQEAEQRGLYHCEGVEANFTPGDIR